MTLRQGNAVDIKSQHRALSRLSSPLGFPSLFALRLFCFFPSLFLFQPGAVIFLTFPFVERTFNFNMYFAKAAALVLLPLAVVNAAPYEKREPQPGSEFFNSSTNRDECSLSLSQSAISSALSSTLRHPMVSPYPVTFHTHHN